MQVQIKTDASKPIFSRQDARAQRKPAIFNVLPREADASSSS